MSCPAVYGLNFHHFGLAVRDYDKAARFLEGLGYTIGSRIFDPLQNVEVAICDAPEHPTIELVVAVSDDSPIANVLKRQETSVYHSCYYCVDPSAALAAIEADGFPVITVSEPKPAVLFCGAEVLFAYISGFGLIEIINSVEPPPIATR